MQSSSKPTTTSLRRRSDTARPPTNEGPPVRESLRSWRAGKGDLDAPLGFLGRRRPWCLGRRARECPARRCRIQKVRPLAGVLAAGTRKKSSTHVPGRRNGTESLRRTGLTFELDAAPTTLSERSVVWADGRCDFPGADGFARPVRHAASWLPTSTRAIATEVTASPPASRLESLDFGRSVVWTDALRAGREGAAPEAARVGE